MVNRRGIYIYKADTYKTVHKIADYQEDELEGTFYEQELQEIIKTDSDDYRVEKVIKSGIHNKQKEHFVKWLGYPDRKF